jgi:hypothetical protein
VATEVEFFKQREAFRDKEQVKVSGTSNAGTRESGQSFNLFGESSQPICGNGRLIGDVERCEFQRETRGFTKKTVEVTIVAREVEGVEVSEPLEEATEERDCWIDDSE